jgi:hypothetical protein
MHGAALALAMAKHDFPALMAEDGEDDLPYCVDEAVFGAYRRVGALVAAFEASAPGITLTAPPAEIGLGALLIRAEAQIRGGRAEAEVFALLTAMAPTTLEITRWMDAVPLDAFCARACVLEALTRLGELSPDEGDPQPSASALEGARERFDAAVAHAIRRHDERDADGHAPSCYALPPALGELFGRPPPGPAPSAMTDAVRAAWEAATTAGLDEIEATRRCLAAAEAEGGKKG